MRILAPAKINLFLRVVRKRPDGYHDIFSLIHKISLYDELALTPKPEGIILTCTDATLPTGKDNLVYRAAELIFSHVGYSSGVEINLNKRIPPAAGLGGGSSDAAATLTALNKMFSFGLKKKTLLSLAEQLGADVPFFIFSDKAFAAGIGNQLKTCKNIPEFYVVLINPQFPLSTKTVYDNLNLRLTSKKINYSIPRLCALGDVVRQLHNDLEEVSFKMHPQLGKLKQILLQHGALGALMSGSGPTVFGIFSDEKSARYASAMISGETSGRYLVFCAQSL
ncbi:MAG TPA: 4-(cytidine 5'-diphospho)-2-C-methyl-D-erythritol kinase [Deltaproteobacteria bacterium]|nr:4-(cytidine 5'-diphospho)-2-C-methyl-D-erythritol kinase [Deltaproteobacteria bacterium]